MRLTTILFSGLNLIALASTATVESVESAEPSSLDGPITFWRDTQTRKHHCDGRDVIRCETPRARVGEGCITIDTCESFCFLHDNGAACVDMDAPLISKVPVSGKVAARAASPDEDEHNECSKDRTGVLICRYGFCSTDYYCKAGYECQDNSFTCAPKSPILGTVKSEVRDLPPQVEAAAANLDEKPSYTCSKDRASVLKCLYGFCSTHYYCAKGNRCIDNPARCNKALSAQTEQ